MPLQLFKHWTYQIFSPGTLVREKYEAFTQLIELDKTSHELVAGLEALYYNRQKADLHFIEARYEELSRTVAGLVDCLLRLAPGPYNSLRDYFKKIDGYSRYLFALPKGDSGPPFCQGFAGIGADDHGLAGGKGINLALLRNILELPVPDGFVITTNAFRRFLAANGLETRIAAILATAADTENPTLDRVSREIVALIEAAAIPPEVAATIETARIRLGAAVGAGRPLALRSSAVGEDSALSFAGQYRTLLGVAPAETAAAWKQVLAGKYSATALYYRIANGLADEETPMAAVVMPMIEAAASGVMFTTAPGRPELLEIHATSGPGEPLVSGRVGGEEILVAREEPRRIVSRPPDAALGAEEALTLARWGGLIEDFFHAPQEAEWCLDWEGRLHLLQSRTLRLREKRKEPGPPPPLATAPVLLAGGQRAAGGAGTGPAFVMTPGTPLSAVPAGSVLVCETIPPAYVQLLDRVRAVVADRGSVAGHFAIVAREFGVPTLVAAGRATALLPPGGEITVDADRGMVYRGAIQTLPAGNGEPRPRTLLDRRLSYLVGFVSPLRLVDPASPRFLPSECRSLHDIIRFVHEKGMREMFAIGDRWSARGKGGRRLRSGLPFSLYLLDTGGGLRGEAKGKEAIAVEDIRSVPFRAIWTGLADPAIDWAAQEHFDWKSFDSVALAGGVARKRAAALASFAVVGKSYLNLNLRFGYHFTIVDTLCGPEPRENYLALRFAGGGGDFTGRTLRVEFLAAVLRDLGLQVRATGDLLDGRLADLACDELAGRLETIGRLLGVSRLLDMALKDRTAMARYLTAFREGRYRAFAGRGA